MACPTGLAYRQLTVASKGWKRAAIKRAKDLALDIDSFPLYVDPSYTPPSATRRAGEVEKTSSQKVGKHWSAFHQKYQKDNKEKKDEHVKVTPDEVTAPPYKKMPTWRPKVQSAGVLPRQKSRPLQVCSPRLTCRWD